MDLSHWSLVDSFTMWEAAYLAGGVDPKLSEVLSVEQKAKARLIYQELEKAYELALRNAICCLVGDRDPDETVYAIFQWESLPSVQLEREAQICIQSGRDFNGERFFNGEDSVQAFSRVELDRWFGIKKYKPIYSFVPLPEERSITGLTAPNNSPEAIGRREQQHEVILAVIAALSYDPLNIPDGGKAKIKAACLTRPRLFTSDSFDHAWKAGASLFRMANHEKYSPK